MSDLENLKATAGLALFPIVCTEREARALLAKLATPDSIIELFDKLEAAEAQVKELTADLDKESEIRHRIHEELNAIKGAQQPVAWAHRLINKSNGVAHPWKYGSAEKEPGEGDIFRIEVAPLYAAAPAAVNYPVIPNEDGGHE